MAYIWPILTTWDEFSKNRSTFRDVAGDTDITVTGSISTSPWKQLVPINPLRGAMDQTKDERFSECLWCWWFSVGGVEEFSHFRIFCEIVSN